MTELKECPFCGADLISRDKRHRESVTFCRCVNCDAAGPYSDTKAGAVRVWNTRHEIKADPQPCMYIGSTACTHPQENCGPWCVDYDELPF